jgi:hypothetical protein
VKLFLLEVEHVDGQLSGEAHCAKLRGAKPFDMTPFTLFLRWNLERMGPLLCERVPMHRHPGVHGVVEAAEEILCAVPGIEVVDLQQPAVPPRAAGAGASGGRSRRRRRAGRGLSFRSS